MPISIDALETERLRGQKISSQDFPLLHAMSTDPIAMELIGGVRNAAQTRENLEWNVQQWQDHQVGLWMFYEKSSRDFIGRGGIRHVDVEGVMEIELAYALKPAFWGKGYATEIGHACLDVAFNILHYKEIVASTRQDNIASQRVMEKLGFTFEKKFHQYGHEQALYRLIK